MDALFGGAKSKVEGVRNVCVNGPWRAHSSNWQRRAQAACFQHVSCQPGVAAGPLFNYLQKIETLCSRVCRWRCRVFARHFDTSSFPKLLAMLAEQALKKPPGRVPGVFFCAAVGILLAVMSAGNAGLRFGEPAEPARRDSKPYKQTACWLEYVR